MSTQSRRDPRPWHPLAVLAVIAVICMVVSLVVISVKQSDKSFEAILDARVAALNEGCADVLDDELERYSGEEIVSIDGELFKAEIDYADRDYVTVDGEIICAAADIEKKDRS